MDAGRCSLLHFCPRQHVEKMWLIPPSPFGFTTGPEWRIAYHWVLGLCLGKRKQRPVLSQDFLKKKNKNKEKVLVWRKQLQIQDTSGAFLSIFCFQSGEKPVESEERRDSPAGSAPSVTCLIISGGEGQNSQLCRLPASTCWQSC